MNSPFKIPVFRRAALLVIGLYFFIDILYIARGIIIPLVVATFIAVLLRQVVNFFVKRKMKRLLAIVITFIMTAIIVILVGSLIVSQAIRFSESIPKLTVKLKELLDHAVTWFSVHFKMNKEEIISGLKNFEKDVFHSLELKNTLLSVGSILGIFVLAPAYVFMILVYEPLIAEFVNTVLGAKNNGRVREIFTETNTIIQSYLAGLLIEMALVATLNSIGLLILGIPYAILLGLLGALLNLIPYLGNIVSAAIYIVFALVAKDSALYVIYILILYTVIQVLNNNVIVPKILGARVKLNAMATFIAIVAGNSLWGIAGMFLAIPLIAIVKVVCDHIESLRPWGKLMGTTLPPP